MLDATPEDWARSVEEWRSVGATHVTVNTGTSERPAPEGHLEALRRFQSEVLAQFPDGNLQAAH
jgi:hypothetical protein